MNESSPTVSFVQDHMTNPNGTIATYLQDATSERADIVAGREALSESLGLWMQYAVCSYIAGCGSWGILLPESGLLTAYNGIRTGSAWTCLLLPVTGDGYSCNLRFVCG